MNDMEWTLSVGQMAARSGVAVSALHFYESKGLIRSERSSGNQRRYARSELRRIAVIRVAQRVGMSLEDIAQAFSTLPTGRAPTRADWSLMARTWRESLNQKIAQLEQLRDTLDDCIGCGCLSLQRCKLRNPADELGQHGAGAHRLEAPSQASR